METFSVISFKKIIIIFLLTLNIIKCISSSSDKNNTVIDILSEEPDTDILTTVADIFGIKNKIQTQIHYFSMLEQINKNIDPCVDFYEYACGNFKKKNAITPGTMASSTFHTVKNTEKKNFVNILMDKSRNIQKLHKFNIIKKTQNFYESCIKADLFNYTASKYYLEIIENEFGGWPILNENFNNHNNNNSQSLIHLIASMRLMNSYGFIFERTFNMKFIQITKTNFGLIPITLEEIKYKSSRNYIINFQLMKTIMIRYGIKDDNAIQTATDIMNFGRRFLENLENLKKIPPKYWSINKIQQEISNIDWIYYFSILFNYTTKSEIDKNFKITIQDIEYFHVLSEFFTNSTLNDQKIIRNYLIIKLLFDLHDEYKYPKYEADYCVENIKKQLQPIPILMYFESEFYNKIVEKEILDILNDVKETLKDMINEKQWLNKNSKMNAIKKINSMITQVGSHDIKTDFEKFDILFENLTFNVNNYYENNIKIRKFHTIQQHLIAIQKDNILLAKTNKINNSSSYNINYNLLNIDNDVGINAKYFYKLNKIHIPTGVYEFPIYINNKYIPKIYNFGAFVANIIGHEMIHSFDTKGLLYNMNGKINPLFTKYEILKIKKYAECFTKQYNQYKINEIQLKVDGIKTLNENIADNSGLRLGYLAYKKWLENHNETIEYFNNLDDIDDTDINNDGVTSNIENLEQLFFISYAQGYCSEYKFKMLLAHSKDEHTIDRYRVIGSLSNFDQFSKAFNCSLGTPMNPQNKCVLW